MGVIIDFKEAMTQLHVIMPIEKPDWGFFEGVERDFEIHYSQLIRLISDA